MAIMARMSTDMSTGMSTDMNTDTGMDTGMDTITTTDMHMGTVRTTPALAGINILLSPLSSCDRRTLTNGDALGACAQEDFLLT